MDYSCRAIVELSLNWPNETPVQVSQIAKKQGIPIKFLIHILISLKQFGIVKSIRGKSGGYILAKSPEEIKLSDLVSHFGEGFSAQEAPLPRNRKNLMTPVWEEVDRAILYAMKDINFESICNQIRVQEKVPTFVI